MLLCPTLKTLGGFAITMSNTPIGMPEISACPMIEAGTMSVMNAELCLPEVQAQPGASK